MKLYWGTLILTHSLLSLSVLPLFPTGANAQSDCVRLLIPNIVVTASDSRSRSYLRDVMCQLDFKEFSTKYGINAFSEYRLIVGGDVKYNNSNYRASRAQLCRDRTVESNSSALLFSSTSIIPEETRDRFVECMKKDRELACGVGFGLAGPTIWISYNPPDGRSTATYRTKNGTVNWPYKKDIPKGLFRIQATIANSKKPFWFTLDVVRNSAVNSCAVYFPDSIPSAPVRSIVERIKDEGRFQICFDEKWDQIRKGACYAIQYTPGVGTDTWKMTGPDDRLPPTQPDRSYPNLEAWIEAAPYSGDINRRTMVLWNSAFRFDEDGSVYAPTNWKIGTDPSSTDVDWKYMGKIVFEKK